MISAAPCTWLPSQVSIDSGRYTTVSSAMDGFESADLALLSRGGIERDLYPHRATEDSLGKKLPNRTLCSSGL
jgi:hypothetical protein